MCWVCLEVLQGGLFDPIFARLLLFAADQQQLQLASLWAWCATNWTRQESAEL